MASGAQDWTGRTDIIRQTLAELTTRIKYGAIQRYRLSGVGGLGWSTVFDASGKGIIYGGYFNTNKSAAYARITIDGTITTLPTFALQNTTGLIKTNQDLSIITKYDDAGKNFTCAFMGGITFETQYKMELYFPAAGTLYNYGLLYALV